MFPTFDSSNPKNKVVSVEKSKNMTILCRGYFPGQASDIDFFLRSSLELEERRMWDTNLTDLKQVSFVVDNNMVVIEKEV